MKFILKGVTLETLVSHCLNDLDQKFIKNQINGIGADHFLLKEKVVIEAKNSNPKNIVSLARVKEEIISRFSGKNIIRLLIISKLNASEKTKIYLQEEGITVIEIGQQILDVSYRSFCEMKFILFSMLKSFFTHLARIKDKKAFTKLSIQLMSLYKHIITVYLYQYNVFIPFFLSFYTEIFILQTYNY